MRIRKLLSLLSLLSDFIMKVLDLSNVFLAPIKMMVFFFFIMLIWYITLNDLCYKLKLHFFLYVAIVCCYFVEHFFAFILVSNWFVAFFSCDAFVLFWYHTNTGLIA